MFGFSRQRRALVVAHCDRAERVRIIIARLMTRPERSDRLKKASKKADELRPEYDLSKLKGRVRRKHIEAARAGTNLVLLEPDVAEVLPDASAVNEALRMLAEVASRQPGPVRKPKKRRA